MRGFHPGTFLDYGSGCNDSQGIEALIPAAEKRVGALEPGLRTGLWIGMRGTPTR